MCLLIVLVTVYDLYTQNSQTFTFSLVVPLENLCVAAQEDFESNRPTKDI